MVGVNFYTQRLGTVAIFATLFAAILVKGEKGCIFDFEHDNEDFDLECNDLKANWAVKEIVKDSETGNKRALVLEPDQEGCLKTKHPISLNSSSAIVFRFNREVSDDNGKLSITLKPKEGTCSDEECVWNIESDPQYKKGQWVSAEYKFPVKQTKEYYVQIQVGKSKGRFYLDHLSVPSGLSGSTKCHTNDKYAEVVASEDKLGEAAEVDIEGINTMLNGNGSAPGGGSGKSMAPALMDISKNLLLTSASVLTLNTLLN